MPNYNLMTTAQFLPFTFELLLKGPAMATEYEEKTLNEIQDLMDKAAVLELLKNEPLDNDVYNLYLLFLNTLEKASDQLGSSGISASTRNLINLLRRLYSSVINPIQAAYNERELARKKYNDALLRDPSLLTNINPNNIALSEYMGKTEASMPLLYALSGDSVMELAAKKMQVLSKNKLLPASVEKVMNGLLFKISKGYGYSENDIEALKQYPEVQLIITDMMDRPEVSRLGQSNMKAVENRIVEGILLGRLYNLDESYMNAPVRSTGSAGSGTRASRESANTLANPFNFASLLPTSSLMFTRADYKKSDAGNYLDKDEAGNVTGVRYEADGKDNRKDIFKLIEKDLREYKTEVGGEIVLPYENANDAVLWLIAFGTEGLSDAQRTRMLKRAGVTDPSKVTTGNKALVQTLLSSQSDRSDKLIAVNNLFVSDAWNGSQIVDYLSSVDPNSLLLIVSFDPKTGYVSKNDKVSKGDITRMLNDKSGVSDGRYYYDPNARKWMVEFNYRPSNVTGNNQTALTIVLSFDPKLNDTLKDMLEGYFSPLDRLGNMSAYEWAANIVSRSEQLLPTSEQGWSDLRTAIEILLRSSNFFEDFRFDKIVNNSVNLNTASAHK